MNENDVRAGFVAAGMPGELADEVLEGYVEAKRRYYLGDHRPTAVEGGRFCEAVARVLEHELLGNYTKLGRTLPPLNDKRLAQFAGARHPTDALRVHLPRALFLIYGVRNKRDIAHLGDGIDPNLQDATLVANTLDWMMAELVRTYHTVSPDEAHATITDLVTREVPVIEEIDGQPVCSKALTIADQILVFLYRAGRDSGLAITELQRQMRHSHKGNLTAAVKRLDQKGLVLVHPQTSKVHITSKGLADVESRHLLKPASP